MSDLNQMKPLTDAARDVLAERQRQINVEGYTPKQDDRNRPGDLASAAACYVLNAATWLRHPNASRADYVGLSPINWTNWPWDEEGWKPKNERIDLIRAAALILAELERMDRAHGVPATAPGLALVQTEPTAEIALRLTGYDLRDPGLSKRDRDEILQKARKLWASDLLAAAPQLGEAA